ncbi:MAG: cation:proton antiporter, partial [Acidimicrobiia bacterium]
MDVMTHIGATTEGALFLTALIIILGPMLAERLKLPGMIGLLALGAVVGPNVLGWLGQESFTQHLGSIGLLYLMFLAGLELDLKVFAATRKTAVGFGLLTFAIPIAIGFAAGLALGYAVATAALIGSMWASHTLVAYPEAREAGVEAQPPVAAAVGATVITDTLALLVLAWAASQAPAARTPVGVEALVPLWLGVPILFAYGMWLLPRIGRSVFQRFGHTRTSRFAFLLFGLASAAVVSELGGVEGLVGAFAAGLGLNRLVPGHSRLMEQVEFFGSALFIPTFLISVGTVVDPAALVDPGTLRLAAVFIGIVTVGKAVAAAIAGRIFGLDGYSVGLMWMLTMGQAAATLAAAQVGLSVGIFGREVVNATLVTVVVALIATSFGTRYFARRVDPGEPPVPELGSTVAVLVTDGEEALTMALVAVRLAAADGGLPLPVGVVDDADHPSAEDLKEALARVEEVMTEAGADVETILRVDDSVSEGFVAAAAEKEATMLLVPWEGPGGHTGPAWGRVVDSIGRASSVPTAAVRSNSEPWERIFL